ncbi:ASCH domain-containing protein [Bosea sp. (in: a-proteobacteria)]|uniref:ASCH domain-containing protein n=1 Tax=Bosea sp. (in: a-proteobacteria) TaxID=1871050 RepID=UPI003B3B5A1F
MLKALSVRQPWAWLIFIHKDVENRTWATEHRGPTLIHAAQEIDRPAHERLMQMLHPVTGQPTKLSLLYPPALGRELERGGIVGVVDIHGCVTRSESEWFTGPFGFLMRHRKLLPFQRCRGMLGFFRPDIEVDLGTYGAPAEQGSLL